MADSQQQEKAPLTADEQMAKTVAERERRQGKPATPQQEKADKTLDKDAERERVSEPRRQSDDPTRKLARRAVEIAEAKGATLGSAITGPQAELIKSRLGSDPTKTFAPATLQQLQDYAQGGKGAGRDGIDKEAIEKIRTFCRQAGSRRIWPRKVAAMVIAVEEERTGRTRPGTKAAASKEPAKAPAAVEKK